MHDEENIVLDDDFLMDLEHDDEYDEASIAEERREGFTNHGVLNDFSFPDWKRKKVVK